VHDFRRLDVWHEAVDLAGKVYQMTEELPEAERFSLVAQMRRAAVSVSSNIAEGSARGTDREMARFLTIAIGSLSELDSQVELAVRLGLTGGQADLLDAIGQLRARMRTLHDWFDSPQDRP
jgi:four helix bundle protein